MKFESPQLPVVPENKKTEEKLDPDLLLAMELQKEEMEAQKKEQKQKPAKNPPKKDSKKVSEPAPFERKEYTFALKSPIPTFVCMYPELLTKVKANTQTAVTAQSAPAAPIPMPIQSVQSVSSVPSIPSVQSQKNPEKGKKEEVKKDSSATSIESLHPEEFEVTKLDV